jgi:hypothetical protein
MPVQQTNDLAKVDPPAKAAKAAVPVSDEPPVEKAEPSAVPSSEFIFLESDSDEIKKALAAALAFTPACDSTGAIQSILGTTTEQNSATVVLLEQLKSEFPLAQTAIWFIKNQAGHENAKRRIEGYKGEASDEELVRNVDKLTNLKGADVVLQADDLLDAYAGLALAASKGSKVANGKLISDAKAFDARPKAFDAKGVTGVNWPGIFAAEAAAGISDGANTNLIQDVWVWLTTGAVNDPKTVETIAVAAAYDVPGALDAALAASPSAFKKAAAEVMERLPGTEKGTLNRVESIVDTLARINGVWVGLMNADELKDRGLELYNSNDATTRDEGLAHLALATKHGSVDAKDILVRFNADIALEAIKHVNLHPADWWLRFIGRNAVWAGSGASGAIGDMLKTPSGLAVAAVATYVYRTWGRPSRGFIDLMLSRGPT